MTNYQGSGTVSVGGSAVVTSSSYYATGSGSLSLSGTASFSYTFNDLTCDETQFPCVVKIPNKYRKCFNLGFFKPEPTRLVPSTLKADGAFVAVSTICQQYPFTPLESLPPRGWRLFA